MPEPTYHPSDEDITPITAPDSRIADLELLLDSIDKEIGCALDINYNDITNSLIGKSTIDNGGMFGDIIDLIRGHIRDAQAKSEIKASDIPDILAMSIDKALSASLEVEMKKRTLGLDMQSAKIDLLLKSIDAKTRLLQYDEQLAKTNAQIYTTEKLLPLEREKLKESIEGMHLEHILLSTKTANELKVGIGLDDKHNIDLYTLNNVLPAQLANQEAATLLATKDLELKDYNLTNILPAELALSSKELEFKIYEFDSMLPIQLAKLENETELVGLQRDAAAIQAQITDIDRLIKLYYYNNIQPNESLEISSRARIEYINAGTGFDAASMPRKKIDIMDKQIQVYDEQIKHYQTDKDNQLLKLMTNYQSMIYPDLIGTDKSIFTFANTTNASAVFDRLNK